MIQPIAYVVAAAIVFGSGWQVRSWYDGAKDAAVLEAEKKTQDKLLELASVVATKTEESIQNIKIENRTIYQKATHEIVNTPVYRDCILPRPGVMHINAARAGAATGKPDNRVPARATPAE